MEMEVAGLVQVATALAEAAMVRAAVGQVETMEDTMAEVGMEVASTAAAMADAVVDRLAARLAVEMVMSAGVVTAVGRIRMFCRACICRCRSFCKECTSAPPMPSLSEDLTCSIRCN